MNDTNTYGITVTYTRLATSTLQPNETCQTEYSGPNGYTVFLDGGNLTFHNIIDPYSGINLMISYVNPTFNATTPDATLVLITPNSWVVNLQSPTIQYNQQYGQGFNWYYGLPPNNSGNFTVEILLTPPSLGYMIATFPAVPVACVTT